MDKYTFSMKHYPQNFNNFANIFKHSAIFLYFMKHPVSYGRVSPAEGNRYLLNFAPCTIRDSSPYARKT